STSVALSFSSPAEGLGTAFSKISESGITHQFGHFSPEVTAMAHQARLTVERLEGRDRLSRRSYSLTTDKSVYQAGELIRMTFTETNTTQQAIGINAGPSNDGFNVTQNGQKVWQSNTGPPSLHPTVLILKPGRSLTFSATWDGIPNGESTV